MDISIAILAGGMSRRFGSDKTLALLEGKPLIQWLSNGAQAYSNDVMIISKEPAKYEFLENVRQITDCYEQQCPMVGIIAALDEARHDKVLVLSADMPLFPFESLPAMADIDFAAIVPEVNGKLYPCAAIYSKSSREVFLNHYEKQDFRLTNALSQISCSYPDERFFEKFADPSIVFTNVNTTADLLKIKYSRAESLRDIIDSLDRQITALLDERTAVTDEVGRRKAKSNTPVYDPAREQVVIDQISEHVALLSHEEIKAIYEKIMEISKKRQKSLN